MFFSNTVILFSFFCYPCLCIAVTLACTPLNEQEEATSLMLASEFGHIEFVEFLLGVGVDVEAQDDVSPVLFRGKIHCLSRVHGFSWSLEGYLPVYVLPVYILLKLLSLLHPLIQTTTVEVSTMLLLIRSHFIMAINCSRAGQRSFLPPMLNTALLWSYFWRLAQIRRPRTRWIRIRDRIVPFKSSVARSGYVSVVLSSFVGVFLSHLTCFVKSCRFVCARYLCAANAGGQNSFEHLHWKWQNGSDCSPRRMIPWRPDVRTYLKYLMWIVDSRYVFQSHADLALLALRLTRIFL